MRLAALRAITGFVMSAAATAALAAAGDVQRLITAYPEQLSHIEGNDLVWRDGTRMAIDDGRAAKTFETMLREPDLEDMFFAPYPAGRNTPPVSRSGYVSDPGRVRHAAFFAKMYGDCGDGSAARHLVDIVWLARIAPQRLKVTRVNGVAQKLEAVSRELEALPATFHKYLMPSAGTYVCRPIAGTSRVSAHGYGIAIDINPRFSDYWRWGSRGRSNASALGGEGARAMRIPFEIVEIFERHGFIWGGKWHHYDTMHFEYRPELLAP